MTEPSRRPPGRIRATAVAAALSAAGVLGTAVAAAVPAWAAGSPGPPTTSPTEGSLQIQAQELAAQIQADGRELDKMAEAYNAAQIRNAQLDSQVTSLQAQSVRTAAAAASARKVLKEQAVLSYVVGGAPLVGSVPGSALGDRNIALSYAEIVSSGQKRALDAYHQVLSEEAAQARQLAADQHEVTVTLSSIASDRAAAVQADAARRQALAQVNGQMAALVAQVQAQQQAAARAAALASEQRTASQPPATASKPPSRAPGTAAGPSGVGAPASTAAPPPPAAPPPTAAPPTATGSGASGSSGSPSPSGGGSYTQAPGADKAIAYAYAQLGKPYQWGGAGPDSFDCSGLTMMAWEQAGIYFPHLAQDQYDLTQPVAVSSAIPGDLIFFGTPSNVYHVGLYIGNGQMIDAPETGQNVSIQSIYWSDLLGAGRVTGSS
jgi:cell wall-associated NlpC family hydrolase